MAILLSLALIADKGSGSAGGLSASRVELSIAARFTETQAMSPAAIPFTRPVLLRGLFSIWTVAMGALVSGQAPSSFLFKPFTVLRASELRTIAMRPTIRASTVWEGTLTPEDLFEGKRGTLTVKIQPQRRPLKSAVVEIEDDEDFRSMNISVRETKYFEGWLGEFLKHQQPVGAPEGEIHFTLELSKLNPGVPHQIRIRTGTVPVTVSVTTEPDAPAWNSQSGKVNSALLVPLTLFLIVASFGTTLAASAVSTPALMVFGWISLAGFYWFRWRAAPPRSSIRRSAVLGLLIFALSVAVALVERMWPSTLSYELPPAPERRPRTSNLLYAA